MTKLTLVLPSLIMKNWLSDEINLSSTDIITHQMQLFSDTISEEHECPIGLAGAASITRVRRRSYPPNWSWRTISGARMSNSSSNPTISDYIPNFKWVNNTNDQHIQRKTSIIETRQFRAEYHQECHFRLLTKVCRHMASENATISPDEDELMT